MGMHNWGRQSLFLLSHLSESILEIRFPFGEELWNQYNMASSDSKQAEGLVTLKQGWVPTGCHPAWAKAVWVLHRKL